MVICFNYKQRLPGKSLILICLQFDKCEDASIMLESDSKINLSLFFGSFESNANGIDLFCH